MDRKKQEQKRRRSRDLDKKNTITQQAKEDTTADEHPDLETKWITLETRPKNIAIGVFYGPQEGERIDKTKEIYNTLETQILQKLKKQDLILGGDFNAKLDINQTKAKQNQSRNGEIIKKNYCKKTSSPQ